jgi:excisionase family DNA binding protein
MKLAYGIQELPKLAPLSRSSLYKAIAAGKLKTHKAGRRTLVLAEDFAKYLHELPTSPARQSRKELDHA